MIVGRMSKHFDMSSVTVAIFFNAHVVLVGVRVWCWYKQCEQLSFENLGVSEEVLGSGSALWFSPEGNRLAFARFDDTNVDEFTYFKYGEPGTLDSQYPEVVMLRYPKVKYILCVAPQRNHSKGISSYSFFK